MQEQFERDKMRVEQKSAVKNSTIRFIVIALLFLLQVMWIALVIGVLAQRVPWISTTISILTMIIGLGIYGRHINAAFKMPWMIFISVFPMFGLPLYMLMGRSNATKSMRKIFQQVNDTLEPHYHQEEKVLRALKQENPFAYGNAQYVWRQGKYPVKQNTRTTFYPDGAEGFEAQVEAARKAEKFLFLEYHAIEDGAGFAPMKEILKEKAAKGVDVRLFYDDMGSIWFVNGEFKKEMEAAGVKCVVFNPISPIVNVFMNNRDHRKIMVVDGKVGFVTGYNLADEYFHLTMPYGFWKDTGMKLEGEAVKCLTLQFFEMWNAMAAKPDDVQPFIEMWDTSETENTLEENVASYRQDGFVQPYAESPMRSEALAEEVYMNMLRMAQDYVYFVTPYLVLTDEMVREMTTAAKRGVDVRIITPGIPDKKMVYKETRSYYPPLLRGGVRIFEYRPGFSHAKMCVVDGKVATLGTINLDFRSLYLHFENGVVLYGCPMIQDMREDFDKMLEVSVEVPAGGVAERGIPTRFGQLLLRLIAPLL